MLYEEMGSECSDILLLRETEEKEDHWVSFVGIIDGTDRSAGSVRRRRRGMYDSLAVYILSGSIIPDPSTGRVPLLDIETRFYNTSTDTS